MRMSERCPACGGPVEKRRHVQPAATDEYTYRALPDTLEGIGQEWVHYLDGKPNCYHPELLERALRRLFNGCETCGRWKLSDWIEGSKIMSATLTELKLGWQRRTVERAEQLFAHVVNGLAKVEGYDPTDDLRQFIAELRSAA